MVRSTTVLDALIAIAIKYAGVAVPLARLGQAHFFLYEVLQRKPRTSGATSETRKFKRF